MQECTFLLENGTLWDICPIGQRIVGIEMFSGLYIFHCPAWDKKTFKSGVWIMTSFLLNHIICIENMEKFGSLASETNSSEICVKKRQDIVRKCIQFFYMVPILFWPQCVNIQKIWQCCMQRTRSVAEWVMFPLITRLVVPMLPQRQWGCTNIEPLTDPACYQLCVPN